MKMDFAAVRIVDPEAATSRNPQPLDMTLMVDNVDAYKRSDCRFYKQCLNVACRESWAQFHCNDCQAFAPLEVDSDGQKKLVQLGRLLARNGRG
jgi:hypothetical protein